MLKGLLWAGQWWKYERKVALYAYVHLLSASLPSPPTPFLTSSPRFFNGGSYGPAKLEGLPSGQISLSEGLPWVKGPLESWPEAIEREGRESGGMEEMGRPEVVGLEVGRELT